MALDINGYNSAFRSFVDFAQERAEKLMIPAKVSARTRIPICFIVRSFLFAGVELQRAHKPLPAVVPGFFAADVANLTHVVGLIAGFGLAVMVYRKKTYSRKLNADKYA